MFLASGILDSSATLGMTNLDQSGQLRLDQGNPKNRSSGESRNPGNPRKRACRLPSVLDSGFRRNDGFIMTVLCCDCPGNRRHTSTTSIKCHPERSEGSKIFSVSNVSGIGHFRFLGYARNDKPSPVRAIASCLGQPKEPSFRRKPESRKSPGKERAGYRAFWIPAFAGTTVL